MSTLRVLSPEGRIPYRRGLRWQREVADLRIEGELDEDLLVLLEHEPVLTLGRNAEEGHVTVADEALERLGVDRVEVERGGDVTYHGPGQLVGYPIFDLREHRRDLHWFLRRIEEALIRALARFGLDAFRVEGHTGVWVGEPGEAVADGAVAAEDAPTMVAEGRVRKIASIGIHVSRWVSWHGFALNVTREPLENFRLIVPCGIRGVRVTSLAAEGADPGMAEVREAVVGGFRSAFGTEASGATADLGASLPRLDGATAGSPTAARETAAGGSAGAAGGEDAGGPDAAGPGSDRDGSGHATRSATR